MDCRIAPVKVSRPRGRPPKVKRGLRPMVPLTYHPKNTLSSEPEPPHSDISSKAGNLLEICLVGSSSVTLSTSPSAPPVDTDEEATPRGSKRPPPNRNVDVPSAKRARSDPCASNPTSARETMAVRHKANLKAATLPARRSARHSTIQSTQLSEGTLRPPGPPCLEAALGIALRDLESEMWRYLWAYHKQHRGGPLPTPVAVKAACSRVRTAAEAVDRADRELEDAIDEAILSNSKKRPRGGAGSGKQPQETRVAGPNRAHPIDDMKLRGSGVSSGSLSGREKGSETEPVDKKDPSVLASQVFDRRSATPSHSTVIQPNKLRGHRNQPLRTTRAKAMLRNS